jgi:hypothetical protein
VSAPPPASGGRSRVAHLEAGPHLQSPTESEVNVAGITRYKKTVARSVHNCYGEDGINPRNLILHFM